MNVTSHIAQYGMNAAQGRLNTSAQNIANQSVRHVSSVPQQDGTQAGVVANPVSGTTADSQTSPADTDLTTNLVYQVQAKSDFKVNAEMVKTQDEMLGSLLDIQA